jgi:hypothetical protein
VLKTLRADPALRVGQGCVQSFPEVFPVVSHWRETLPEASLWPRDLADYLPLQKHTGWSLKPTFNKDFLESHPFHRINYDHLIVKLSKLFDLVRTRGHPVEGDSTAGGSQSAFVRSTTKYWVHDENIVPLKLAIMRHLPVLGTSSATNERKDHQN